MTVFIYTPGRCGTMALSNLCNQNSIDNIFLHTVKMGFTIDGKIIPKIDLEKENRDKCEFLQQLRSSEQTKIIISIREPIARCISAAFSHHSQQFKTPIQSVAKAKQHLLDLKIIGPFLNWLDSEAIPTLGVDIYSRPFNVSRGYSIIETEQLSILLLRADKILECIKDAAFEAWGMHISLPSSKKINSSESIKSFDYFRKNVLFSKEELKSVYETKFCKHFFSQQEINRFYEFWSNRRGLK